MQRLTKTRILDLTDESGAFCTKLLAAFGADTIRVEPPGGDPSRRVGPFYRDKPHPETSLHWLLYNLNKRSVTLSLETTDGQALFSRLAQTAAIVVECFPPGYMEGLGLGYEQLREVNPGIVLTSITPFGRRGPYSSYRGCDLIASAMSGLMFQSGGDATPPVHASVPLAYMQTGVQAAAGTLFAYYHQRRTGQGQHVDVSQQECAGWGQFSSHLAWKAIKAIPKRGGDAVWIPGQPRRKIYFKCLDGWVAAYPSYWNHMPIAIQWLKENGFGEALEGIDLEAHGAQQGGIFAPGEVMDRVNSVFGEMAARFSKRYLFEEGQSRGMQVAPISSMAEIVEDRHLRARGYYVEIDHPELGQSITYPGVPIKGKGLGAGYRRRAPQIGEHNVEVYQGELGLSNEQLCRYKQAGVI